MRLPDHEDALQIAALVLEVEREDVDPMVREDHLHFALLAPTARFNGGPLHRKPGQIARALWVACAAEPVVPRRRVRFGWLMVQRSIELSGYRWEARPGDSEQLRRFGEELEERHDPGEQLSRWLDDRIRPSGSGERPAEPRVLHVTSPISNVPPHERATICDWATAVDGALGRDVSTRRPQIYPAAGATDAERAAEIEKRLAHADGLVALAMGGSWGGGIELEKALRAMIPILFLHPKGERPGPRTAASLRDGGATIRAFTHDPLDDTVAKDQIHELVRQWIEREYPSVLGRPRRHAITEARLASLLRAIRSRQVQMTPRELAAKIAVVGLTPTRVRQLTDDAWQLRSASVAELLNLCAAHGVPANLDGIEPEAPKTRPAHLTDRELFWLEEVTERDGIPGIEVAQMVTAAQRQVAAAGMHRITFDDAGWRALRERQRGSR